MDSIIEILYYNTVDDLDKQYFTISNKAFREMIEDFLRTFSKEQNLLFEKLKKEWIREQIEQQKQMFAEGFKKGFTLCMEIKE